MPDDDWFHVSPTPMGPMTCRPLTMGRFSDMEEVFGERGTARRCFCMHWRYPDGGFGDRRDNRDRFAERVAQGRPPGLLGYLDETPVGWVQVGPRDEFPTVQRSPLLRPVDDLEVWAINCFVVRTGHRRRGVGKGLLQAAIEYAKDQGAPVIEAYPVDGERSSAVDYFTGTLSMFEAHGFAEVIRRNETRPIVRFFLGDG